MILVVIIFFIFVSLFFIEYRKDKKIKEINKKVDEENAKILKENQELMQKKDKLNEEIEQLLSKAGEHLNNQTKILQDSISAYSDTLEQSYELIEKKYDENVERIKKDNENKQQALMLELKDEEEKLQKIKNTRIAAINAQLREKKIKEDLSFYCLNVPTQVLNDVQVLERIKPKLSQPRILCMLIWSTYFQKPMTTLCNNVLGKDTVTGIYKITNQETNECYIGQAVDVATRWKSHAKCGLGIDTPVSNKLYKAMQEYGIWSFSWELLETCPQDQLNEKEKFYISLYDSKDYGYNSTIGNKRS